MSKACSRRDRRGLVWVALALVALAAPVGQKIAARREVARRLRQASGTGEGPVALSLPVGAPSSLLASWQSVGGCGAGAASGGGVGVKWIGRSVSGGLFTVQSQASYTLVHSTYNEDQLFVNNLITRDVGEKWQLGVNIPVVYKYLHDPHGLNIDLSNGGLGDVNLQVLRRLGPINNTFFTASLGLPTGTYDQRYKMIPLRGHSQLGFGKVTGSLTLDHMMDELWGVVVVGGTAAWRGGENSLANYRAPSASAYAFTGWYVGPFVPALGLAFTGFTGHDRDATVEEYSALVQAAPTLSLEWATEWCAVLVGASFPYQYNGVTMKDGRAVSPWGWGDWTVSVGLSVAPF
jgi:hypothetical protein